MSYNASIRIVTTDDKLFKNAKNVSIANAFRNIGKHFEDVAIGSVSENVTLNSGPTFASATITIASGNMADEDTVTINSIALSAETVAATNAEFNVGSDALQTAINLTNCINGNPSLNTLVVAVYSKSSTSGVVTVTSLAAGTVGNYTLSQSGSNVTLLPTTALGGGTNGPIAAAGLFTFSSFVDEDTITVGVTVLSGETVPSGNAEFAIGASDTATAANAVACINANPTVNKFVVATVASGAGTFLVSALDAGVVGNFIPTAISAHGSVSGSNLGTGTGSVLGTNANYVILSKGI